MIRWVIILLMLSLLLVACGGDDDEAEPTAENIPAADYDEETVMQGQRNYGIFCTACHGPDAAGVTGLGPSLLASDFFNVHSDEELLDFVIEGRPIDHPDNATGIAMPPRGGYPNLSDEQITDIIAYLRTEIADS